MIGIGLSPHPHLHGSHYSLNLSTIVCVCVCQRTGPDKEWCVVELRNTREHLHVPVDKVATSGHEVAQAFVANVQAGDLVAVPDPNANASASASADSNTLRPGRLQHDIGNADTNGEGAAGVESEFCEVLLTETDEVVRVPVSSIRPPDAVVEEKERVLQEEKKKEQQNAQNAQNASANESDSENESESESENGSENSNANAEDNITDADAEQKRSDMSTLAVSLAVAVADANGSVEPDKVRLGVVMELNVAPPSAQAMTSANDSARNKSKSVEEEWCVVKLDDSDEQIHVPVAQVFAVEVQEASPELNALEEFLNHVDVGDLVAVPAADGDISAAALRPGRVRRIQDTAGGWVGLLC